MHHCERLVLLISAGKKRALINKHQQTPQKPFPLAALVGAGLPEAASGAPILAVNVNGVVCMRLSSNLRYSSASRAANRIARGNLYYWRRAASSHALYSGNGYSRANIPSPRYAAAISSKLPRPANDRRNFFRPATTDIIAWTCTAR